MPPDGHERSLSTFHRVCYWCLATSFKWIWGFRVQGLEHLPRNGPLIIAGNHSAWIDGPLLFCAVTPVRPIAQLAKAELFNNRFSSWFFTGGGSIKVDRRGDVSGLREALDHLEKGGCLGLFPHGTRVHAGKPERLKPGLGFLAALSRAKVVPAHFLNTERFPFCRPLEIRFGPALEFSGDPRDRDQCLDFARLVMTRVHEL